MRMTVQRQLAGGGESEGPEPKSRIRCGSCGAHLFADGGLAEPEDGAESYSAERAEMDRQMRETDAYGGRGYDGGEARAVRRAQKGAESSSPSFESYLAKRRLARGGRC